MGSTEPVTFYDEHPFDWVTPDASRQIRNVVSRSLADFINELPSDSLVFDIGCGAGRVIDFVARRGVSCVGLDRSRVSVGIAVQRSGARGVVGDNLHLPFADGAADFVISDGVIHHTKDPSAAFAENCRILKPGGRMYLAVYKASGRYPVLYRYPGRVIRLGLCFSWSRPLVVAFAQVPYFLVHFLRSRGKRTWAGAGNLFYDYFVTPCVSFIPRDSIEGWCAKQEAQVLRYDENFGANVHSFLLQKKPAHAPRAGKERVKIDSTPRPSDAAKQTAERSDGSTDHWTGSHLSDGKPRKVERWIYKTSWCVVNALLTAAIFFAIYSAGWEYSTRAYLTGFSDAIVPATAPPDEKIQAILDWMSHGPARLKSDPPGFAPNRDPTDTLNYDALLRVCGTATNAFLNLVNTGGLAARRLLLLDSNRMTKHVVAEVLVGGKWVVIDPAYRVFLRGPDGNPVTREELAIPAILAAATRDIRGYDPSYTFDQTAHIRLARLHIVGTPLRLVSDRLWPEWQNSPMATLMVERESLAAVVGSITAVFLLILLRVSLRWYGERRLGICHMRVRKQLIRVYHVFFSISDHRTA